MRTTLDIDPDVLSAAKERARFLKITAGKVLSDLARHAILEENRKFKTKNGFPVFAFPRKGKGKLVTMEMVNRLRDETE
jgi:hypothetical protein